MNLKDFLRVATKLKEYIGQNDPIPKYQAIVNYDEQARSSPTQETQTALSQATEEVKEYNRDTEIELVRIPKSQLVLGSLGAADMLGEKANQRLTGIFADQRYLVQSEVNKFIDELNGFKSKLNNSVSTFEGLGVEYTEEEVE